MNCPMRMKKYFLSYVLACGVVSLSACSPILVAQTQVLPSSPRPMQRVVVVVNDDVYSHFVMRSSAMTYLSDLRSSLQRDLEQKGMVVETIETNSTDLSNSVAQAVREIKPTHILRLYVTQTRQHSRSMSPDGATWMFDVQQEVQDATTPTSGQPGARRVHRFRSIYRVAYDAPACAPLISFPNQQQTCTDKLVSQFVDNAHSVGLIN